MCNNISARSLSGSKTFPHQTSQKSPRLKRTPSVVQLLKK